jgi:beta-lactamase regulating signal transducer with metallopeptidase domain
MTGLGEGFAGWWLHAAIGGGLILLLVSGLTRLCRQPTWKQRLSEWGALAALAVAGLSTMPSWFAIPLFRAADIPSPEILSPALDNSTQLSEKSTVAEGKQPLARRSSEGFVDDNDDQYLSALALLEQQGFNFPLMDERGDPLPDWSARDSVIVEPKVPRNDGASGASPEITPYPRPLSPQAGRGVESRLTAPTSFDPQFVLNGLSVAYLVTAAAVFSYWLLGHIALWKLLRRSRPAPQYVQKFLQSVSGDADRLPRLLISDELMAPISCGLLRPVIVLPAQMCDPAEVQALRCVLMHEWTHIRRRDNWACLLFGLGQVVYFYVPWFWWLRRQVRLCQEYVADAAAVEQASDAADYAQYLLSISQIAANPVAATGVSGNSSDLFRRMTMLLRNPYRVETHCPKWLSPVAGFGLLSVAILVSGVSLRAEAKGAGQDEPKASQKDEQPTEKTEKPKKTKKKAVQPVPRDESSDDRFPAFGDEPQQNRQWEQTQKLWEQATKNFQQQFEFQPRFGQPGQPFMFGMASEGRLGVHAQKPNPALADQLSLPENQGVLIEEVRPDSPAAKAGIKVHDILLEFNGKPVPNDIQKLRQMVDEVKADSKVDAVVLRKGKKETITGITLPEAKPATPPLPPGARRFGGPDAFQRPGAAFPNPEQRRSLFTFSGPGGHNVITTIFRDDDRFTTRHQEGSLIITVTGTVAEGKAKVKQIEIQDGSKDKKFDSIEDVPEQYRDKVKNLLDMNEKGTTKIEIRTPDKKRKSAEKPKKEGDEDQ